MIQATWLNVAETVLTGRLFQEGNIAPNVCGDKLRSVVLRLDALYFFCDPVCTLNIPCSLEFPCKSQCYAAVQAEQTLGGLFTNRR